MNPHQLSQSYQEESSERSHSHFLYPPEQNKEEGRDGLPSAPHVDIEEEKVPSLLQDESVHMSELENSREQNSLSKEYSSPLETDLPKVQSSQELFNNTVNVTSKKTLMEMEEKRKKRKIRKAQKHFRGSSFGQGSAPKNLPESMKSYEYGSNGYALEDSSGENTGADDFTPPSIDALKSKITKAVSGKALKKVNLTDKKVGPAIVSDLIKCVSGVSNEDMLEYIIDMEKEKHDLEAKFSEDYK